MINILVSAGHYPKKPGACFEGFCEHDEACRWASMLAAALDGHAVLVPTGVLKEKIEFIKLRQPTLAVEVHFNSDPQRRQGERNALLSKQHQGTIAGERSAVAPGAGVPAGPRC